MEDWYVMIYVMIYTEWKIEIVCVEKVKNTLVLLHKMKPTIIGEQLITPTTHESARIEIPRLWDR